MPQSNNLTGAAPLLRWQLAPSLRGLLAAVVTVLIWTAFIVVARATADPARTPTLTPYDIVFARLLGASLCMLPMGYLLTRRQRTAPGPAPAGESCWGFSPLPWGITWRIGLFAGLLYPLVAYTGFVYAPAAHASVLMPGSLPLWTTLLALLLLGEKVSPARVLGLVCIVVGDLLVGGASLLHALDGGSVWRGDLLFIAGAMAWAAYSVQVRKHALAAVHVTVAVTVFSFFTYAPAYLLLLVSGVVPGHLLTAPLHDVVLQMLVQGVGSVVISGITFNMMIRYYGAVRSTMLTALVPGLSALLANLLLHEPLPWNVLGGLALVTVGIVFGVRQSRVVRT